MKKISVSLLSFVSLICINEAFAEEASNAATPASQPATSNFTQAQKDEIEKLVGEYLTNKPEVVTNALQAGMAKQQEEAVSKMEKAVTENKDKIFNDAATPVAGNPKGTQSLVVFMDPYCGYCKKFHGELETLLSTNKDVKVIFKDIPIMGEESVLAIKAMLAAKEQGKYEQLQQAIFSSDKHLTEKQLLKLASSLDIDTKKLKADMKNKDIQVHIDQDMELAKALGINGTPTLIIGESKVVPGYVNVEELSKMLKETAVSAAPSADSKAENKKTS
jgi:protein-disulfide isomerase